VLVEIPIAMNLEGAEAVVAAARERDLTLGVVHPMRFRPERQPIVERVRRGEERVSHVQGRFFIHRLENVGATGLQRSWTDNLLWHHTTHLVDLGLWLVSGGDMTTTDARIRSVYSAYPPVEPRTGIPMELVLVIETHDDQTVVTTGSYYAREYVYDTLAVTDRDSYRVDERRSTLYTGDGEHPIATEQENAELIAPDFVAAVAEHRDPAVPGWSVLPAMRVLHRVQEAWDAKHGRQIIPGRPVV
jgi:2-hydroxy-4-carboxymuconate semialdehyde hemiacetal dehydrogenase